MSGDDSTLEGIAIIGMSGRFPGAPDINAFWRNLLNSEETISTINGAEPTGDGVYVPRRGLLDRPEWFDAAFFGISPREAEIMDPQQRVFLEECWNALEDAGCDPTRHSGAIGVFAGMSNNTYWSQNVAHHPELIESVGWLTAMMANEKDYLATRVAYKLNLRGPALSIYTACSTSLVAVCQAVQGLLNYTCDVALAGGISITFPHERGYLHDESGVLSPDGHCRAFDSRAAGTVFSSGVGVVTLKRLADAIADNDQIYAVIKGAALNNDGGNKVSFTTPSVEGHAEVIGLAHALADIDPRSIGYVEAHGTGAPLGDPIEIAGLTQAFRTRTDERNFCAIGSVKTNIGHLDAAAGIAGLIKTALVLKHGRIPSSLHYTQPNPALCLEESPFYVVTKTHTWLGGGEPRRAGVSSFGVGGTNAHVVLEEAPTVSSRLPKGAARPFVLLLSAKSETAVAERANELADFLDQVPSIDLRDVDLTLAKGRSSFTRRQAVVCASRENAINALRGLDPRSSFSGQATSTGVVFMFPGQGAQYARMGAQLYAQEQAFRTAFDECCAILEGKIDLRAVLFSPDENPDSSAPVLSEIKLTQPAIFAVSYAMARLWMSRGVTPAACIGHSVGEYVAAVLAGVFTLADGLGLVAARALLVQEQPSGAMLAARISESDATRFLSDRVSVAAVNEPDLIVFAGPTQDISLIEAQLLTESIASKRLDSSRAFHSPMMDPVVAPLAELAAGIDRRAPAIPIFSCVTEKWLTEEEAVNPQYWARHVRETVRFASSIGDLLAGEIHIFLECGPGQTLTQLTRHRRVADRHVVASMRNGSDETISFQSAMAQLWSWGVDVDFHAHSDPEARRISLPTYPFERQRYFADAPSVGAATKFAKHSLGATQSAPPLHALSRPQTSAAPVPSQLNRTHEAFRAIEASHYTELVPFQRENIDSFVARYVDRTGGSKRYTALHRKHLADPHAVAGFRREWKELVYPLVCDRSEGARLWDIDGNEYVDITLGCGQILFGHRPSFLVRAIEDQLHRGIEIGTISPKAGELAERLARFLDFERIAFCNTGSEAIAAALQLARTVTGREQVAVFSGAHRGIFDEVLFRSGPTPLALRLPESAVKNLIVLDYGTDEALQWLRTHAGTLAAVLVEPVQSRHPALAPREFLHEVRRISQTQNVALIFDETVTGFRLAPRGAQEHFDIRADIAIYGKVIGGGIPVGIVAGSSLYMDAFDGGASNYGDESFPGVGVTFSAGTFVRHPLALAAVSSVLEQLEANGPALQDELTRKTNVLVGAMNAHLEACETPLRWEQCASLYHLPLPPELRFAPLIFAYMRLRGIHAWENQPCFLSTAHSQADVEQIVAAFREGVNELIAAELLPGKVAIVSEIIPLSPSPIELESVQKEIFQADPADLPDEVALDEAEQIDPAPLEAPVSEAQKEILLAEAISDDATCAFNDSIAHHILERGISNPETAILKLPILSSEERDLVVSVWNETATPYPSAHGIDTLFEVVAASQPDSIAIIEDRKTVTYGALNFQANLLAERLLASGAGPGSLIGICAERSVDFIVTCLAAVKLGGAYVPLDPSWPAERIESMARAAKLSVVVTRLGHARHFSGNTILLDGPKRIEISSGKDPDIPTSGSTPAYVIYTSGSTGTPKGVVVPHRAISRLVLQTDYVQLTREDVVGHASNPAFDAATFEIWGALLNGARIVILPQATLRNAAKLGVTLATEAVTTLFVPTALFNQLAGSSPSIFRTLRHLLVGGDVANSALIARVIAAGKPERLFNIYGPTEVTTFACAHEITTAPATDCSIPIGRPIANTRAYILDQSLEPVPIGTPGELYLGGDGVALGYYGSETFTAERFFPDPFRPGERIYRSGDRARWRNDGEIDFLGRIDGQTKLRGIRVELGEIEIELSRHPDVRESAVKVLGSTPEDKSVAAYFIPANGHTPDPSELRTFLNRRLPEYMIPSAFVALETFPLTSNGKVDRQALPDPTETKALRPAPMNATQQRVAELMEGTLGQIGVGVDDDFFRLGGHSLLAMDFMARLRKAFGVEVPSSVLFETPSIREVAAFIEAHLPKPSERTDFRFLVPIQHGSPDRRPLFLVAGGWGGEVELLAYAQIGHLLGSEQPIWGLKARGAGTSDPPHKSASEMAADYLAEIRALQPVGPYSIAGEWVGGICAHEIACQLRDSGEQVSSLILLDTSVPNEDQLAAYLAEQNRERGAENVNPTFVQRIRHHWKQMGSKTAAGKIAYLFKKATGKPIESEPTSEQHPRGLAQYPPTLMKHRLRPYPGKVTLLVDEESYALHGQLGWENVPTGDLELHVLPGDPLTYIWEEGAQAAQKLREILSEALQRR